MPQPLSQPLSLDANATTALDPAIADLMREAASRYWANPSSIHRLGREARVALDDARELLAALLACRPSEIIFTSGGTEANNLAVLGAARARRDRGRHLVCSPIEHPSVLRAFRHLASTEGFEVSYLPVDSEGRVLAEALPSLVRPDTLLVSVMAANNEIGTLQPVTAVGSWCRDRGILFHCDAVQWFAKETWPGFASFPADLVTLCSHKFHGPRGAGVLVARSPLPLAATAVGGSQEGDRRAGTENLPAILGLVEATRRFAFPPVFNEAGLPGRTSRLRQALTSMPEVHVVSPASGCLPNTVSFTVPGSDSLAVLANLDLLGICASSGSACSAGALEPSHVLLSMGLPRTEASALVRFSLDRFVSDACIDFVAASLPSVLQRSLGC